ncbi:hypothetical protein HOS07_gp04 [Cronobacter phage ESSI-2]|uniref:Uncharacterized protein n=1 Tax=Cronobacter phage ESSI-2 TaxID=947842 RepID=F1BUK0_9CAUD|nr:hypothetical protein HOS07_gp04 [Cronobacter phage ESSI-2]ADX32396.1 hypothetical protein [Cronobacter phage ESSI-2]
MRDSVLICLNGTSPTTRSSLPLAPCSAFVVALVWPLWSLSWNCWLIVTRIFFSGIASPLSASMIVEVMDHSLNSFEILTGQHDGRAVYGRRLRDALHQRPRQCRRVALRRKNPGAGAFAG